MNTKDFIRLGVPLGEATRRATDFVSRFILSGGDKTKRVEELEATVANPALFAEDPIRMELAKTIVNAPPAPLAELANHRHWGEGLEHEAVMQTEINGPLKEAVKGVLGSSRGASSDFGCKLFDLALETSHFLQRALCEDGKLLRLCGKQLLSQRGERFAHSFQLLDRLSQDSFGFNHKRTRSNPFLSSGASRTRLKNSTYLTTATMDRTCSACNSTF